ncbi:MAG TPA: hypothetical protein VF884_11155 [Nitrososphaeraceae archaeon]
MQTKRENRDVELENLVGNLLIAEYQVEKLKGRVANNLGMHGFDKISSSVFKYDKNWYRATIRADRLDLGDKNSKC